MKIGIAVRKNDVDYFVHQSYVLFLKKINASIDIVTLQSDLSSFDAFLLPGGTDIDSRYYGQAPYACFQIDEEMDQLDRKIILEALQRKKPLLGICRGIQSINVFLGGTLKQNVLRHQSENHFILFQNEYHLVNSYHHQAIDQPAPNFEILAYSLDHEIEMIRHRNLPILGVQFHPELMESKINENILNIFSDF